MRLVGRSKYDFVNDGGERIAGVKLHIVGLDDRVDGEAVWTQSIKKESPLYKKACELPFGEILIDYGRRGSVENICSAQ